MTSAWAAMFSGISGMWGGSWSNQLALLPRRGSFLLSPASRTNVLARSLKPRDEIPGLKSVHVGPVIIQAPANRLPLGRTALLINQAAGKWVVCTWGPLCRDQAPMKTSECEWKKKKKPQQSTFHVCCRRAKTRFYLKITPSSFLKAESKHMSLKRIPLSRVTSDSDQETQLSTSRCHMQNKRKLEGCFPSIQSLEMTYF